MSRRKAGFSNYDIRLSRKGEAGSEAYRQRRTATSLGRARQVMADGQMKLAASVPELRVEANERGSAPEIVGVEAGCDCALTPPSHEGRETIARRFLAQNAALYGLTREQVAQLRTIADYTNPAGNLSWVEFEQHVNGLPVFQGYLRAALMRDGRLVRTTGNLAPGLDYERLVAAPQISAASAVVSAASTIGVQADLLSLRVESVTDDGRASRLSQGPFDEEVSTELVYFPIEPGVTVLAYSMVLWEEVNAYYILVDASDGQLLWRKNITHEQTQTATYGVYDNDSPTPLSPSNATPGSNLQGAPISRSTLTLVSELPGFDNLGWITDGGNTTTGNNVDAGLDVEAPNGIDTNGRAVGSPNRVFNFAYNPGGTPGQESPVAAGYRMGAVTNIFFWANRYHDRIYQVGFTEAARNFQNNNFGRGGTGGDFVRAEVQDSSGTNNANFATPPDGSPPRMQMYVFTGPTPDRDADLDADVFLHELTHGTSERLHANASGLTTRQALGLGEGWSDFYARALLSSADEDVNGIYPLAGYVTRDITNTGTNPTPFTDNYYYGIRRFPYAVKTKVGANGKPHNPLTFADIDPAQLDTTDGAFPESPLDHSANGADEVHNMGEVWCMALLEVRARLIARLGYAEGNERMMQIVTDGMKLDPSNPTLLQARDSILAADCAGFDGEDEQDIWEGFAARGMGFSARLSGISSVTEAFDLPNLALGTVKFSDAAGNNNHYADPGEALILTIPLHNPFCSSTNDASNTTAAIAGGGSASYGFIAHGATVTKTINYTVPANTSCGARLTLAVEINSSLGPVTRNYVLQIGKPLIGFSERFDSVTAPSLPTGWMTAHTGAESDWVTSNTRPNTAPNSAFAQEVASVSTTELVTPAIAINSPSARLTFKNLFNTEESADGMVLEISINGGAFQDILAAGGSFVSGGYNSTISTEFGSLLAGRHAWSGLSGGNSAAPAYITSVVDLPASANGRSVRLKFRVGCDNSLIETGATGVRLDSLTITTDAQCSSPTPLSKLSIDDVTLTEGDSGALTALFTVSLSASSSQTVTVDYATANKTAVAQGDYLTKSGTLSFSPGQTVKKIAVPVRGDTLDEVNETFNVNLSNPTNATIVDGQGVCTITDNDPQPRLSINNVNVTEGNSGTLNAVFTVSLSAASGKAVTVRYATANGTATAPSDYTAKSGTLSLSAGQTSMTITVAIKGDTVREGNETFFVNLSAPVNATIADAQGLGTILNND